jgi:putative FmdB family regulatory protein
MPTYEYECKICGYTFEQFQHMSDEPVKICPECGKEVRRLINGGGGVIFKGSGFYTTDKAGGKGAADTKSAEKAAKPDEAKSADQGGSADASAKEAKAESKAEPKSPPPEKKPESKAGG